MSRRSFAKILAATAAAGSVAGFAGSALAEDPQGATTGTGEVKRIRSGCRGCGKMECGVWVTVQDGKVIKTEGDESAFQGAGNHCGKGQASLQAAYHPTRLMYPMKRTGPKGQDPQWERVSWDEAAQILADGFNTAQGKYGNETYFSMGGTSRIWAMGPYAAFGACFGSPNAIRANQVCKGPRFYATSIDAFNAYSWMEVVGRPAVYVQWGGASELSNYDDACRTTVDVATRAQTHILVDPRQTNLGKEADIWINLRPGTDAAVALAMHQVIIEQELYDDHYVRKWMNAPMLVVEEASFEPTPSAANSQSQKINTRLLKESDILEGGSSTRFMVLNEVSGNLSYYDASVEKPGWEGEDWKPATEGFVPKQPGLDLTGQDQGFVIEYTPFPDGLMPALHTQPGGLEVTLKDGSTVHVRTVWERFIEYLEDYTPEKSAEITGVPAEKLREAAIAYGTRVDPSSGYGNGGIQYMLALEHACNAAQNNRACDLLAGITGNMDTPGGMRGSTPGGMAFDLSMNVPTSRETRVADNTKIIGQERFTMIGSDCSPGWADATSIYDTIATSEPYKLSCGMGQTGDFMNQSNSLFACEQLMKLDFWVSIELWHTPTTEMAADLLLPAAHWLELDCIRKSQGSSGAFGATVKAIEPPGEALDDLSIIVWVFKAMGVPYFAGTTDEEKWGSMQDANRRCNEAALASGNFRILDWEQYKAEFQQNGWFDSKIERKADWGTYRRYETGVSHISTGFPPVMNDHPGWNTTTHKQELWSTVFESWLVGEGEEFPRFVEPPHGPIADPDLYQDENSFTLTTGRRQGTYFHSEHRQLPWCRELWPVPRLEMNPVDAERIGVKQGDWVWIETDFDEEVKAINGGEPPRIRQVVDLYYGIAPGVANAEHQWWYPELDQPDKGFKLSGVNCLIDRHAQDRIIASSNLRVYGAKIYKATPENSPFGNPVPCDNNGNPIIHTSDDPRLKTWLPTYEGRV
ncbi:MAG: molybdopterin-dependent oxidoreductase [Coriobacteriales bacterium]|nr:molybdopterin-dependent oxidoreductase [Coriobacteriales bacterium]